MILLNTYRHSGYTSKWATAFSYEIVSKIRESLDIPALSWSGMNAAWTLRQRFCNVSAKSLSVCCNPSCTQMTYTLSGLPERETRYCRQTGEPGNPLFRTVPIRFLFPISETLPITSQTKGSSKVREPCAYS